MMHSITAVNYSIKYTFFPFKSGQVEEKLSALIRRSRNLFCAIGNVKAVFIYFYSFFFLRNLHGIMRIIYFNPLRIKHTVIIKLKKKVI